MVKTYRILKLQTEGSYTRLFQINWLVVDWKYLQKIIFFQKHLTQNFKELKYGLQIKIANH